MKTAEEILRKWYNPLHGIGEIAHLYIIEAMREYANWYAREALKNASKNSKLIYNWNYKLHDVEADVDQESILSESNLPSHG